MYITFDKTFKTQITGATEQSYTIADFLLGKPIPKEKTKKVKTKANAQRITVDREDLTNFFESHISLNWLNVPKPPEWCSSKVNEHYTTFHIPKKTGGYRRIDAPDNELKAYLTNFKIYFEDTLHVLPHDCAHAYVKGRSTKTDLEVHQANQSNWFLKLDLKDFFGSHNYEYTIETLKKIYPIGLLLQKESFAEEFNKAIKYAFLEDKLPQGTPLSPTLTNILMVPIDHAIQKALWDMKNEFVLTRYADDLTISSPYDFDYHKVIERIEDVLTLMGTPYKIKTEKTRYGSKNGRNWNLGMMLNKDNRITIGHKQNQRFRAMIHNLMMDYVNGTRWSQEALQELAGKVAYYKMVDPEYTDAVIKRYEKKFRVRYKTILKHY